MYGSYPIYSGYEQSCDFTNGENGDYCDGGFLKDKQGYYKLDQAGLLMRCPKCGDKRIVGVGSFIEIPVPDGDKQPDLRNPVQMLTVDRNSLDYNVSEEERLRTNIITAVVGTNEEITTREALNEQQIKANFESQSTVLNRVKKGFEAAQKFVDETVCCLFRQKSIMAPSFICLMQPNCENVIRWRKKAEQARGNWMRYKIRLSKRSTDTTQYKCNVC